MSGSAFARSVESLRFDERNERVAAEILGGNVPEWTRALVPVQLKRTMGQAAVVFWATPDYLAVGSDADYLLMPMSPGAAQQVADRLRMSLPTPRMVDAIWSAADMRLPPAPIPPSEAMTTVPVFVQHATMVRAQVDSAGAHPGVFLAGHKKDVVISRDISSRADRVAIYGWHRANGEPFQPLYLGHTADWVDYSHGIRLVSRTITVDGEPVDLWEALRDPVLALRLSGEGVVDQPFYRPTPR